MWSGDRGGSDSRRHGGAVVFGVRGLEQVMRGVSQSAWDGPATLSVEGRSQLSNIRGRCNSRRRRGQAGGGSAGAAVRLKRRRRETRAWVEERGEGRGWRGG